MCTALAWSKEEGCHAWDALDDCLLKANNPVKLAGWAFFARKGPRMHQRHGSSKRSTLPMPTIARMEGHRHVSACVKADGQSQSVQTRGLQRWQAWVRKKACSCRGPRLHADPAGHSTHTPVLPAAETPPPPRQPHALALPDTMQPRCSHEGEAAPAAAMSTGSATSWAELGCSERTLTASPASPAASPPSMLEQFIATGDAALLTGFLDRTGRVREVGPRLTASCVFPRARVSRRWPSASKAPGRGKRAQQQQSSRSRHPSGGLGVEGGGGHLACRLLAACLLLPPPPFRRSTAAKRFWPGPTPPTPIMQQQARASCTCAAAHGAWSRWGQGQEEVSGQTQWLTGF